MSEQLVALTPEIVQVKGSLVRVVKSRHVNTTELPSPTAAEMFTAKLDTVAVAGAKVPGCISVALGNDPPPIGK